MASGTRGWEECVLVGEEGSEGGRRGVGGGAATRRGEQDDGMIENVGL